MDDFSAHGRKASSDTQNQGGRESGEDDPGWNGLFSQLVLFSWSIPSAQVLRTFHKKRTPSRNPKIPTPYAAILSGAP